MPITPSLLHLHVASATVVFSNPGAALHLALPSLHTRRAVPWAAAPRSCGTFYQPCPTRHLASWSACAFLAPSKLQPRNSAKTLAPPALQFNSGSHWPGRCKGRRNGLQRHVAHTPAPWLRRLPLGHAGFRPCEDPPRSPGPWLASFHGKGGWDSATVMEMTYT